MAYYELTTRVRKITSYLKPKINKVKVFASLILTAGLMTTSCGSDHLGKLDGIPKTDQEHAFGFAPIKRRIQKPVVVSNKGTTSFKITGFALIDGSTQEFSFSFPMHNSAPAGGTMDIPSSFYSNVEGSFRANAVISTDSRIAPELKIVVTATAVRPELSVPATLNFGRTDLNNTRTRTLVIENGGRVISDALITGISGEDAYLFTTPGRNLPVTITINPRESVAIEFKYLAARLGGANAQLNVEVPDSIQPNRTVNFMGEAVPSGLMGCLVAVPAQLNFGDTSVTCPAKVSTLTILNSCNTSVKINQIYTIRAMDNQNDFLISTIPLPITLGSIQGINISLTYKPNNLGVDKADIFIVSDMSQTLIIPVNGKGVETVISTDVFMQERSELTKLDILMVMDNSCSMENKLSVVRSAATRFFNTLDSMNLAYNLAITTTGIEPIPSFYGYDCPGGAHGGEAGRLFPVDNSRPRVITNSTADKRMVFEQNLEVGLCHATERGLEAAYLALSAPLINSDNSSFYRPDAQLSVIIISDEQDQSPRSVAAYTAFFQNLKSDPRKVKVNSVLDTNMCSHGSTLNNSYEQVVEATGGISEHICTTNWGNTLSQFNMSGPLRTRFQLNGTPRGGTLAVKVNGQLIDQSKYNYNPNTNEVIFNMQDVPPEGSRIEVTYTREC